MVLGAIREEDGLFLPDEEDWFSDEEELMGEEETDGEG